MTSNIKIPNQHKKQKKQNIIQIMDRAEAEQEEEYNEWVIIQTSPKSSPSDASTPPDSPILQPSHRRENPTDDDDDEDEDCVVPVTGEEDGDYSSNVNISLPWRVIETAKKRLIKEVHQCSSFRPSRGVFWSLTFIGGFALVSSLIYVRLMRWWRRLQEEKLRFLLQLLREKDQVCVANYLKF